ncbi:MAG: hypothetical protein GF350_10930 [Chitinivibrionales bacterium]|nr:hypothetical protein [Chitinivibrionales bacterium]
MRLKLKPGEIVLLIAVIALLVFGGIFGIRNYRGSSSMDSVFPQNVGTRKKKERRKPDIWFEDFFGGGDKKKKDFKDIKR